MPVSQTALQELLFVANTTGGTTTSVANHGAAPTSTIGGAFTTTAAHPNIDVEVNIAYLYASVASNPSIHVMIDGVADANCQGEAISICTANFLGMSPYRKFRYTTTPGAHTISVFIKNSTAATATFSGSSVNPTFLRVSEAP